MAGLRWNKYLEMPPDEMPPREIWLDDEELERHWAKVAAARREKYGIPDDDGGDAGGAGNGNYEDNGFSLIARG